MGRQIAAVPDGFRASGRRGRSCAAAVGTRHRWRSDAMRVVVRGAGLTVTNRLMRTGPEMVVVALSARIGVR